MIKVLYDFRRYGQHLVDIQLQFDAQPFQELSLPAWIPGSYMIREFSKHLESLEVQTILPDGRSQPAAFEKLNKNTWRILNPQPQSVIVSYSCYAYDLSVRGSYVDHLRIFINPASTCLCVRGQESDSHRVTLNVPDHFGLMTLSTALCRLKENDVRVTLPMITAIRASEPLVADSYADLIDSPFEIAEHQVGAFEVNGVSHQISISGRHQTDISRLQKDLEQICRSIQQFFGFSPFDRYLFMLNATGDNLCGGLEHHNSTAIITPRSDLPGQYEKKYPSKDYVRLLGTCSHEYFHAWHVKTIRPAEMVSPDLGQEAYTRLLWLFEGFTSYYDNLMLMRAGVISQQQYLDLLEEQFSRYWQNQGRKLQSLQDASFDAWIKYYRQDENSNNAIGSYYNQGALLAFLLDIKLSELGHRLDDIMLALLGYARQNIGITEEMVYAELEKILGEEASFWWSNYIAGTKELPLAEGLERIGLGLSRDTSYLPYGMKLEEGLQGLRVQQVVRQSAAAKAGLSANDVIVAVDGIRANLKHIRTHLASQQPRVSPEEVYQFVRIHAFRRDELHEFLVKQIHHPLDQSKILINDEIAFENWLQA